MNESDASGLLGAGMHEMDKGQESYTTECSKMNQDTSAMYSDHSNASAFLEEYNMSGIQPLEELRFDNTQHFQLQSQRVVADSEDESMSSSPDTSSTTNYDVPGYTEQNLQQVYNAYDALVDRDGPVVLSPDFVMCDGTSHIEPHLTFSSDGIKIECLDSDLDKMITFDWGLSNIISISCKWAQSVGSALITLLVDSESENKNSGPVTVQFSLDDLQWPRKQQKIWYLETRYHEIWKDIPSDDFGSENWSIEPTLFFPSQYFSNTEDFEDVIYPKGDPDAVSISKRDAELLLPETFVNDTIIDFYIKYMTTRIDSTEKRRYHFFNSFFFRKLADLDKDQGRAPEGRAAFLRVRKWTRKINIFEKDFVFIPVNFSLHWSLIVVCYPGEAAALGDGAAKLSAKLPCILHMDSLKGSHSGLKDIIQSYLWEEWKERHPESAADYEDKFLNLRFVSLELPQQDNSFDCGLFLLHYVELFLMDVPSNFNPLKLDVFSSFLSDDWFPPADASHKRSVIQKLIHEVVTGSLQNHPKLVCSNDQLDEKHQSRNPHPKSAGDFPAQSSSADQAELVCTIRDDGHVAQQSTSICLNDSEEKVLSASGGMVNTGSVSMVSVQNLQEPGVCLQEGTVVCLSSQDEENKTLVGMRSCDLEDGEALEGSSCGVSNMEHAESLFLTLDDNQKYPSQAEAKVQDLLSSCHSLSYNSEVITYEGYSLQRNADEIGHECHGPSEDMDSLVILDSSKDDIGPNPERLADEDEGNDLGVNMGSATQSDINKDVAEVKCEDSLADHVMVENAIKDSVKEIDSTADNIDHSEQYVSSELTEGSAGNINVGSSDKVITCDNAVSSGLNEGHTSQTITGGVVAYETNINADGVDAYKHLATSGPIGCGDAVDVTVPTICAMPEAVPHEDTTCTEAQDGTVSCEDTTYAMAEAVPREDTTCTEAQDGTVPHEDQTCAMAEAVPCEDTTCTEAQDGTVPHEDQTCATAEAVPCEDTTCTHAQVGTVPCEGDTSFPDAEMPLGDGSCCIKDETSPENTTSDAKKPLLDGICEEKDIEVSDGKCTQKDDAQVTDKERPLPDSLCEEKVVSGDGCTRKDDAHVTDCKRPLPDGKDTSVPESCIGKDNLHGTDAKIERHYKRRKILAAESQKERSSS